jgi:tetratricopeptide (TPR) repeat protein
VASIQRLAEPDRAGLIHDSELLLRGLFDQGLPTTRPTREQSQVYTLGYDIALRVGAEAFLERAVVLFADSVIFAEPPSVSGAPSRGEPQVGVHALALSTDGQWMVATEAHWELAFARTLLDSARLPGDRKPRPGAVPFVPLWYHAVAAYLQSQGLYAEEAPHLDHGASLKADDANLLVDQAYYLESLGMPFSQQLLTDADMTAMRAERLRAQAPAPVGAPRPPASNDIERLAGPKGIPLGDVADAESERLFKKALELNPRLDDARVHLARLLDVRGRSAEAIAQLTLAVADNADRESRYMAHLIWCRAALHAHDLVSAAAQIEEATRLFPRAQSGRLERSYVALLSADAAGATRPVQDLAGLLPEPPAGDDPWWNYHLGSGRSASRVLHELWAAVSR